MENRENQTGTATATARYAYESSAGIRAAERAGRNPQLKGIVHEVIYTDKITLDPKNIVSGTKGVLSKSTTAVRDDVLTINAGKVVGRAQLKDTSKSVAKTVSQVKNGKYAGTSLMGTNETVEAFEKVVNNAAKKGTSITQKMTSTGISSSDTARIAAQTLGNGLKAVDVAKAASSSAGLGAVLSGGIELISSGKQYKENQINEKEYAENVIRETVGGGISSAGATVAASVVSTTVAGVLAATSAPAWIPVVVAGGAAIAVGNGIKKIFDFFTK